MFFETVNDSKKVKFIFDNGVKIVTPFFVAFLLKKEIPDDSNQLVFIASKKHFKRSVDRNLSRRRLKAGIHKIGNPVEHLSCVLIARRPLLDCDFNLLVTKLESTFLQQT